MHELAAHPDAARLFGLFNGHSGTARGGTMFEPWPTTGVPLAVRQDWRSVLAVRQDWRSVLAARRSRGAEDLARSPAPKGCRDLLTGLAPQAGGIRLGGRRLPAGRAGVMLFWAVGKRIGMETAWRKRLGSRLAGGVAGALAVAFMLASWTSTPTAGAAAPASAHRLGARSVISLNDMSALRSLFNRDVGHPRLVLIFSPT